MSESQLFYRDKQAWENAIEVYRGDDPLELWFNYICWYDYNVHLDAENKFQQALKKCLSIFEHNEAYKQDIRMVKLWVKYIDFQANPLNLYRILYQQGVGTQCSCFYVGWAHYYDSANAFKQAESVFNLGFQAKAEPYIELQEAHTKFRLSVSQRMLYNDNSSKKRSFNNLIEQRQQITALTSNTALKRNKNDNQVEFDNCTNISSSPYPSTQSQVQQIQQCMENKERNYCVDQTITTAIRQNDPNKNNNHNNNNINSTYMMISPIQSNHSEIKAPDNIDRQIYTLENVKLGPNFCHYAKNNFETWKPLLFIEEPFETTKTCVYQKHLVYPDDGTEYSPEEIKARKLNQKIQMLRQSSSSSNYIYEQQQRRYLENAHNSEYVQQQQKSKVQNFNTRPSSFPEKEMVHNQNQIQTPQNNSKIQYAPSQLNKSRDNLQKSNNLAADRSISHHQHQHEESDNIWQNNHGQDINGSSGNSNSCGGDGIYTTMNDNDNGKIYYAQNELQYGTEKSQSTSYYVQQSSSSSSSSTTSSSNSYNVNTNRTSHCYSNSDFESYARNFANKYQYMIPPRDNYNHMNSAHSPYTNETQNYENYANDNYSYIEENCIQQQNQQQPQKIQQQQHNENPEDNVRRIEDTTDYHYMYTNDNNHQYYRNELTDHYHDKSSQTTATIVQQDDHHLQQQHQHQQQHQQHQHQQHQHQQQQQQQQHQQQHNYNNHFTDNNVEQQQKELEQYSLNGNVDSHIEASTIRFSTDADGKKKNKTITIKYRREIPSKYSSNTNDSKNHTTTSTEIDRVKRYMSDESGDDKDYKNESVEQHNFPVQNTTKQRRVKRIKIVNRYDKESKRKSVIELKPDRTSDDSNSFNDSNTTQDICYDDSVSENAEFNISSSNESNSNFTISSSKLSPYPSKTSSSATATVRNFRDLKRLTLNSSSLQNDDSICSSYEQTNESSCYYGTDNGINNEELVQKRLTKALFTIETHLLKSNLDPFKNELCNAFLAKLNFPSENDTNAIYRLVDTPIPKLNNVKSTILADTTYNIEKEVGKGSYGSVYKAVNTDTGATVALKYQKPPNKWEIYICCEVRKRIKNYNILPGFMNISSAIIAPNASIIVTEFSVYGSLLDVNNKVRQATKKVMHESLAIHFGSQILDIVNHLHSCKIIHADIKPDNFLLMKIPNSDSLTPSLRLIDFGCAIDMKLFPDNTQFNKIIQTDGFTCIEMQEGKPWSYQTDLFCVAGTIHVMLFGEYMQILKKFDQWDIKQKLPRYLKKHVWTEFFSKMLNIENLENLPNLTELKSLFDNELRKIDSELQMQIRTLSNILHRR